MKNMREKEAESKLWCAIVMQIFRDCKAIKKAIVRLNNKAITFKEFMTARLQGHMIYPLFVEFFVHDYLSPYNKDLQMVCEYAGFDVKRLLKHISKLFDDVSIGDVMCQVNEYEEERRKAYELKKAKSKKATTNKVKL